jgi:hypothetical protein
MVDLKNVVQVLRVERQLAKVSTGTIKHHRSQFSTRKIIDPRELPIVIGDNFVSQCQCMSGDER